MKRTLLLAACAALWAVPTFGKTLYLFRPVTPGSAPPAAQANTGATQPSPGAPTTLSTGASASLALTGSPYDGRVTASAPVTGWSLASAPPWLSISATGPASARVSGSPPAGTSGFGYVARAVDAQGNAVAAAPVTVSVGGATASIVGMTPNVRIGSTFKLATNLPSPTWLAFQGDEWSIPSADGDVLTVTAPRIGSREEIAEYVTRRTSISVTAQSAAGSASASASFTIFAPLKVNYLYNPTLSEGVDVRIYTETMNLMGSPTYRSTSMPPGLSLDAATGLITGRLAPGEADKSPFTVTVTATDSGDGSTGSQTFPLYAYRSQITVHGTPMDLRDEYRSGGNGCNGVAVQNKGATPLAGLAFAVTENSTEFLPCRPDIVFQQPPCGTTLAPNGACYFGITGKPRSTGPFSGKLAVSADGTDPVEFPVFGNGI